MKPTLIIPYDIYSRTSLDNYPFVLRLDNPAHLQEALDAAADTRQCKGVIGDFNTVDVVTLLSAELRPPVNLYLNCSFDGCLYSLLRALQSRGKHASPSSTTYLFPPDTPGLVTLLKILSSLGYNSGLQYNANGLINRDDYIELATYSYLSPAPHAPIEPFGFIKGELMNKKRYVDLNRYYFSSADGFLHLDSQGKVFVKRGAELTFLCGSIDEIARIDMDNVSLSYKSDVYYSHFNREDECSKCDNFKICIGYSKNNFADCKDVMSAVYELLL